MAKEKYVLVLDTNVLYKNYNNALNFKEFSFANDFNDIQRKIEELDLVDIVVVAVPEMCWEELTIQFIDEHKSKLQQAKTALNKYSGLPELTFEFDEKQNIVEKSNELVSAYKEVVLNDQSGAKTIELQLPDNDCFKEIVSRAIHKAFPFYVTTEHSDYGFKDVVIWESILKYKRNNPETKILLYSVDKGFDNCLLKEYEDLFGDQISILKTKDSLYDRLEEIAKTNIEDVKIYNLSPSGNEIEIIETWLESQEFKDSIWQIVDKTLIEKSNVLKEINVLDYNFISSHPDYDNTQVWMEILVNFRFESTNSLIDIDSSLSQKLIIDVDIPYEEGFPISIIDCQIRDKNETDKWLKQLEEESG